MIENWDAFFMSFAAIAAQKSKDESSQIGACLVRNKRVISLGFNGLPQGVYDPVDFKNGRIARVDTWDMVMERRERPEKYFWYEHAERNAIYNAAKEGIRTEGATMYCACGIPCADCARGIIQAGIEAVVYLGVDNSEKWEEHAQRSKSMFREAKVGLHMFKEKLGFEILRSGKVIEI